MLTSDAAALLTLRIASVAIAINCLEILYSREDFGRRGLISWELIKTAHPLTIRHGTSRLFDAALVYPRFLFLVAGILVAVAVLALDLWPQWRLGLLTGLVVGWLLIQVRLRYGLDGSDQMLSIVLISMWIYNVTPDPMVRAAAVCFIALQLILSYLTSGVAKLISQEWRSGVALPGIMRTRSYGTSGLARAFERWPVAAGATGLGVIVFQCFGFLAVFISPDWCIAFIVAGVLFHLSTAVFMGLNCFLWSFASTFPCVYIFSGAIEKWKSGGDFLSVFT